MESEESSSSEKAKRRAQLAEKLKHLSGTNDDAGYDAEYTSSKGGSRDDVALELSLRTGDSTYFDSNRHRKAQRTRDKSTFGSLLGNRFRQQGGKDGSKGRTAYSPKHEESAAKFASSKAGRHLHQRNSVKNYRDVTAQKTEKFSKDWKSRKRENAMEKVAMEDDTVPFKKQSATERDLGEAASSDKDEENDDGDDVEGQDELKDEPQESIEEQYVQVRKQMADLPFEDLQKLKEKLGIKVYNEIMFGSKEKRKQNPRKRQFKRANKNRPTEMSSKIPVKRARQVVETKKRLTRDPRFDDLSGAYHDEFFGHAYSFIDDIKVREKAKLEKQIKKEKEPEKKANLKYLLKRMSNQEQAGKQKEQKKKVEQEWKHKEMELVKEGKKPFHLKKADKRKLELAEKFKELKKTGNVDNYLTRKRKKNASKEKKKLPKQQQDFE